MKKSSSSGGVSVGFSGLLTIVFIVLKLVGVINWRWLWVLAPIWIDMIIVIVCIIILFIIGMYTEK